MSFQLKPNNPFKGHGILKADLESHSFVCQNSRMVNINLSVFTKSSLEKWLSYDKNKKILGYTSEEEIDNLVDTIVDNTQQTANINVWRKRDRNGEYVEFLNLDDWEYNKSETERYNWNDVKNNNIGYSDTENIIIYLIKLNDFIQEKLITDPIVDLDSDWNENEIAAYEFFTDVNSSKERCISWQTTLSFLKESLIQTNTGKTDLDETHEDLEVTI